MFEDISQIDSVIISLNEGENPTTFYAGINDLITFPIALNNITYQLNVTSYTQVDVLLTPKLTISFIIKVQVVEILLFVTLIKFVLMSHTLCLLILHFLTHLLMV